MSGQMLKERPILFSDEMVRAILDGKKTQTRRMLKPQPIHHLKDIPGHFHSHWTFKDVVLAGKKEWLLQQCPYGRRGDKLWVREAFHFAQGGPIYDAAGGVMDSADDEIVYRATAFKRRVRWTPSIHMPRWASRINLEITEVRVERLMEISKTDALAEGITLHSDHHDKPEHSILSAVQTYRDLWERINGTGSWNENPWVWVIEFKRVMA